MSTSPIATSGLESAPSPAHAGELRRLGIAAAYVLLYVLLDWLSYIQPMLKLGITPWSPQAGLTLAFLLMLGPRWCGATALAALLAEVLMRGTPAALPVLLLASLGIAAGYALLACWLRRWELDQPIRSPSAAARLAAAAVLVTSVVAAGYVGLFLAAGNLPREAAAGGIARYWVGDLNGILTLTPLLLLVRQWRDAWRRVRERHWEVLAQFAAVVATMWIIFGLAATDELRFYYPLFVPAIWIALRWGVPGAVVAGLTIQIALIVAARDQTRGQVLIDLQFLMLTLNLTALLLGAVVSARADALRRVALREAEQRALLATAPDAVLTVDPGGFVRSLNPAAQRLFGDLAQGARRARLASLLPGIDLEISEGRATLEGYRADGSRFPAEASWAWLDPPANEGALVIVRDATERRRAEAELRERDTALARAMRFAVAGELASALAHELNQPITALVSYLKASEILAAPLGGQDERLQTTLAKAVREALRASEVLRRLRDFYRTGALKRELLDVCALCTAVAGAFEERLQRSEVRLELAPDVAPIEGDATQLEIVIHNLLSNAIEALGEAESGRRRILLRVVSGAGETVLVHVEDSGRGIPPEVAQRLFEAFVTNKSDGMGLGLTLSRSLLRAWGGDLSYGPSRTLGGACFTVRVPRQSSAERAA